MDKPFSIFSREEARESATPMVSSTAQAARLSIKPPRSLWFTAGQTILFPLISLTFIIIRSSKHIENSIWAEKLAGGSSDLTNTLGWGGFGNREDGSMSVSTWEHELRPSKDPASLSPLDSVVGQVIDLNSNPSRMLATETMI